MALRTISENDIKTVQNLTQRMIEELDARIPGSEADLKAAEMFAQEMKGFDAVTKEEFMYAPDAFYGFFSIYVVSFMIATGFLFLGGDWLYLALAVNAFGSAVAISQFVFYGGWFDFLFKKVKGYNVIGIIDPPNKAEVKQEIIVCGHHDSAEVCTFYLKWQKLYSIRLIVGIGWMIGAFVLTIILVGFYAATGQADVPFWTAFTKYGSLIGFIFAIPLINYRQRHVGSLGAGDNLISSAMALQIGKIIQEAKNSGNALLKHTRIRVISFDAEEAALKGSKAYVKAHKNELLSIPTYALCPDSLYKMADFKLLTGDLNGWIRTPKKELNETYGIAKELGYSPTLDPFPFGGGGTDAASLLQIGIPAITIMAMPTSLIRDGLVQHTRNDNTASVEPALIEATMKLMLAYILHKEKKIQPQ